LLMLFITISSILLQGCKSVGFAHQKLCSIDPGPGLPKDISWLECLDVCIGFDSEGPFAELDIMSRFDNVTINIQQLTIQEGRTTPRILCTTSLPIAIAPWRSVLFRAYDCQARPQQLLKEEFDNYTNYRFDIRMSYQVEGEPTNRTAVGWANDRVTDFVGLGHGRPCLKDSIFRQGIE